MNANVLLAVGVTFKEPQTYKNQSMALQNNY